jgi:hypothetical protein
VPATPDDERRKLYVAAKITEYVCDAQREYADEAAQRLCNEIAEVEEVFGDDGGACFEMANAAYEIAAPEIEQILADHGLSNDLGHIRDEAIRLLWEGYSEIVVDVEPHDYDVLRDDDLSYYDNFDDDVDAEPWKVAATIRKDVGGLAQLLEESIQMIFDVWEPDDGRVQGDFRVWTEEERAAASYEAARKAARSSRQARQQAPQDNSILAKIGRFLGSIFN